MSLRKFIHSTVSQTRCFASLREKAPKISPTELYEPVFKDPRIYPEYSTINVQLRGYDFVPLEKYQAYVHRIAKKLKFEVVDRCVFRSTQLLTPTFDSLF